MTDVKWVKITTDMFDNRKIKYLRKLPDGESIVLIWIMLLTMAGRCNSGGMIFLTENIPYTPKMLADELDFEESTIVLALKALEQMNMIILNGDYLTITGWEEYQNTDKLAQIREKDRERKRLKRAEINESKALSAECPRNVRGTSDGIPCIDKEKETDLDIIINNNNAHARVGVDTVRFDLFWDAYPKKVGKAAAMKIWNRIKPSAGLLQKMINTIGESKNTEQWQKNNGQYIPNPATWLNQGRWDDEIPKSSTDKSLAEKSFDTDEFLQAALALATEKAREIKNETD